ncbi:MAG TPA: hypothetical protein VGZ02_11455 [Candidatus Baltobacteraceae bacterium]|nr:hypothetical protein [Candidatus Baltobacteraceae bacterium]
MQDREARQESTGASPANSRAAFGPLIPAQIGTKPGAAVEAPDFANPAQLCDIVMKGGVTSGVVYPSAVLRIAQQFQFKNIGGTSAGAIAAAIVAAAEFRRTCKGDGGAGFAAMKTNVMEWLGQGQNLRSLFVPQVVVSPVFYLLLWLVGLKSATRRFTILGALNIVVTSALAVSALAGFASLFFRVDFPYAVYGRDVADACVAAGVLVVVLLFTLVPLNWHGLCTGGRKGTFRAVLGSALPPLSEFLAKQIDAIAGMTPGRPLTFGDLWSGKERTPEDVIPEDANWVLNLSMVTTCLTLNRPFRLPFAQNVFYFKENELRRFFPDYVVDWMCEHPRPAKDAESRARHDRLAAKGFLPLPLAQDLPVIVATRLSLSFPLLFTALRLYGIDWTVPGTDPATVLPEPVWFSDGGLSSNFPIALFDGALPRWPTLAITLEEYPPNDTQKVVMPQKNVDGIGSIWTRFDQGAGAHNTLGFYGAIFNTLQNWQDVLQSEAAGFRDRIVHIRLGSQEGGLNLTMPPQTIQELVARGDEAGAQLVEHFRIPPDPSIVTNWDNHRFIRYRTSMAAVAEYAMDFSRAWGAAPQITEPTYSQLIENPPSYRRDFNSGASVNVTSLINSIAGVASPAIPGLDEGAPKPASEMRPRPEF